MAGAMVQVNFRIPEGLMRAFDELAEQAGQSRPRFLAQLVKDARLRADIEHDAARYRANGGGDEFGREVAEAGPPMLAAARRHRGGAAADTAP